MYHMVSYVVHVSLLLEATCLGQTGTFLSTTDHRTLVSRSRYRFVKHLLVEKKHSSLFAPGKRLLQTPVTVVRGRSDGTAPGVVHA